MLRITGECNQCGQCCGCETAPNRMSPFPATWPEAVRNWQIAYLAEQCPVFQITGHPDLGGGQAGAVRIANKTFRWIWVPGHGLCADAPPWGDPSAYEPQCPVLLPVSGGQYPCGVAGTQWETIATKLGCRAWPSEYITEEEWAQWISDHPACSYETEPV